MSDGRRGERAMKTEELIKRRNKALHRADVSMRRRKYMKALKMAVRYIKRIEEQGGYNDE